MLNESLKTAFKSLSVAIAVVLGFALLNRIQYMLTKEPEAAWGLLMLSVLITPYLARKTRSRIEHDFGLRFRITKAADDLTERAETAYRRAKIRYGIYWGVLVVIWPMLFFLPNQDGTYQYLPPSNAYSALLIRYFAEIQAFEGYQEVVFHSTIHAVGFWTVCLLPLVTGIVCAARVYSILDEAEASVAGSH